MNNNTSAPEPWVGVDVVAAYMDCSDDHVRRLATEGRIPGLKSGNGKRQYWKFKLSQVDAALMAAIALPTMSAKAGRA